MKYDADVIIVGAGPAGASTGLFLADSGLKVVVVDKAKFPRDKICGDAISAYTVNRLKELNLESKLDSIPKTKITKIVFSAPNEKEIKLKFTPDGHENEIYGYVLRRIDFDYMMVTALRDKVDFIEGIAAKDIVVKDSRVAGVVLDDDKSTTLYAKLVVGADGYKSLIARKMGVYESDPNHWLVAVRAYYKGVTGMDSAIEMHFDDSIVPGYFWIFPVEDGITNVGLGALKSHVQKNKINLKKAMLNVLDRPLFKNRFNGAENITPIVGWNLPIGSKQRKVHGNGYILVGDAAGLVDSFTGEGVGNSVAAGKIAAESIKEIITGEDFSEQATAIYAERLWKKLGPELALSTKLLRLAHHRWLINYVINRASKSEYVRDWLSRVVAEIVPRDELVNPFTYIKLLYK